MNVSNTQNIINLIYAIMLVSGLVGGFFALKRGKRVDSAAMQNDAILALQAQVASMKDELRDLKDENTRLKQTLETVKLALLRRGIHVTIDNETIIVTDKNEEVTTPLTPRKTASTHGKA